ncbi:hypothetical protein VTL71DRAFT_3381 [Oculimacula yallundae]|uniref:TRAM domain-containing protein n=1 Tax=Oculimacula yallundae TaxID=86028 RepID=A0ABR4C707_9HELO
MFRKLELKARKYVLDSRISTVSIEERVIVDIEVTDVANRQKPFDVGEVCAVVADGKEGTSRVWRIAWAGQGRPIEGKVR